MLLLLPKNPFIKHAKSITAAVETVLLWGGTESGLEMISPAPSWLAVAEDTTIQAVL